MGTQILLFSLIDILAVILPILLVVAYVTLLERKVLGSMQRRVGPDTVGIYGVLQPSKEGGLKCVNIFIKIGLYAGTFF